MSIPRAVMVAWVVAAIFGSLAFGQGTATSPARVPDVVFVPTPQEVVEAMLKMADVKAGEMVYDLGCGDGRIVIAAARDFGARGMGVDIDPQRIAESQANARSAGVADRVTFRQADLFTMHFADADVVCLYLLPALNLRLRARILGELRPGTRIVSHAFDMGDWRPDQQVDAGEEGQAVYFWIVPAPVAGVWKFSLPGDRAATMELKQTFQQVEGSIKWDGATAPLQEVQLRGRRLAFSFAGRDGMVRVEAEMEGEQMKASVRRGGGAVASEEWQGRRVP